MPRVVLVADAEHPVVGRGVPEEGPRRHVQEVHEELEDELRQRGRLLDHAQELVLVPYEDEHRRGNGNNGDAPLT